mmetsp:Transcript_11464/g.36420  ORF Transcript_11464/g.36420 Transcript_11464/m.36420 type:complete len:287 (+) Transcript_11464:1616-2476(+)
MRRALRGLLPPPPLRPQALLADLPGHRRRRPPPARHAPRQARAHRLHAPDVRSPSLQRPPRALLRRHPRRHPNPPRRRAQAPRRLPLHPQTPHPPQKIQGQGRRGRRRVHRQPQLPLETQARQGPARRRQGVQRQPRRRRCSRRQRRRRLRRNPDRRPHQGRRGGPPTPRRGKRRPHHEGAQAAPAQRPHRRGHQTTHPALLPPATLHQEVHRVAPRQRVHRAIRLGLQDLQVPRLRPRAAQRHPPSLRSRPSSPPREGLAEPIPPTTAGLPPREIDETPRDWLTD